jgi:hypothetical protein
MFPTFDQTRTLVADRQHRLVVDAERRRFVRRSRRHDVRSSEAPTPRLDRTTTTIEVAGAAARQPVSIGRTPTETGHRAA